MEKVKIAKIINTHGIKGECKIAMLDDFEGNLFQKDVVLNDIEKHKTLTVVTHRVHKGFELVTFKEITSMNDAEALKGTYLEIAIDDLCDKKDGGYYNFELIGLSVMDEEGNVLGKVSAIDSTLANDVVRVTREGSKDLLIPFVDAFVKDIDLDKEQMIIHIIEGLL